MAETCDEEIDSFEFYAGRQVFSPKVLEISRETGCPPVAEPHTMSGMGNEQWVTWTTKLEGRGDSSVRQRIRCPPICG